MVSILSTDARGRLSLGRRDRTYAVTEQSDGTIILEPATVVTDIERRFLANTELRAQIDYARAHPEDRVERPRRRLGDQ